MKRLIVLAAAFALLAAGCGGDDGVSVDDPWARNSPRMANAGAIYMDLESGDGDRLIGAASRRMARAAGSFGLTALLVAPPEGGAGLPGAPAEVAACRTSMRELISF